MDRQDAQAIQAALDKLPRQCCYHGDNTEPPPSLFRREACCDTGMPPHRRKAAEEALAAWGGDVVLYVVTGPPAAGKSSWIQAHATARDIVIDLDRITVALTGPGAPQWNHSRLHQKIALRARYAAIEEACQHLDKLDVYLIHTMPSPKAMAKYKRLKAKVIAVDPGRDIVMARIEAMRSPEMTRVASRWYSQRARLPQVAMPQTSRDW